MRRVAAAALICSFAGCTNPIVNGRRDMTLYVSEIDVPASAPPTGTLMATVTVQTGGCKQFDRFEVTRTPSSATIEAKGTDAGANAICTADIRNEKKALDLSGPFSDPFTIRAIQPDATVLLRTVRIQQSNEQSP